MTDIVLRGESVFSSVEINDVVFENLTSITNLTVAVGLTAANTTPSFVYNDGTSHRIDLNVAGLFVGPLAAAEMVAISAGTAVSYGAVDSGFQSANGAVPVATVDATSTLAVVVAFGAGGNSWGGPAGSPSFVTVAPGGTFTIQMGTGDVYWAADNPSGATAVSRKDDYEEAVPADWSGSPPLNVKNALDRIAAAVGPIA